MNVFKKEDLNHESRATERGRFTREKGCLKFSYQDNCLEPLRFRDPSFLDPGFRVSDKPFAEAIFRTLKYRPVTFNEVYQDVFEQAEHFKAEQG